MIINGVWYEEFEVSALIYDLKSKIMELEDENKMLRQALARHQEEEYD